MATGKIQTYSPRLLVELVPVINGGSSSTYYMEVRKDVSKTGYKPIGVVGFISNQVQLSLYWEYIDNNDVVLGVCKMSMSGGIAQANLSAYILYEKTT